MSTIRERIVDAAHTALNTDRPVDIPEFVRTRIDVPEPDQLPTNTLVQEDETVHRANAGRQPGSPGRGGTTRGARVKRTVVIRMEALTKAEPGDSADKRADPSLEYAAKKLAAAGTLGGLARFPADELGTKFDYDQADCDYCRATQRFEYEYETRSDDPSAKT